MRILITTIAAAALALGSASAFAKSPRAGGHGGFKAHAAKTHVSAKTHGNVRAPGQQMKLHGSVAGYPGASGYAPGRLMQKNGSVAGHPGASGYAPGQLRETTGAGVRVR